MTIQSVSVATAGEQTNLEDMRTDPIGLLERTYAECGELGHIQLGPKDVYLVVGAEKQEIFFRAPEEVLDQGEAYPFMKAIFGEGVVFDASPERRQEMLRNQALRGEQMRGHAQTIEAQIKQMVSKWGDEGEIDLLDWFAELTIYTTSACLIGERFRNQIDGRFAKLYHDLEQGTDAMAFVDPYADLESFRQRDAARVQLKELVQEIIDERAQSPKVPREERDLLDVLVSLGSFSTDQITGMFISMMFAGHHTTTGTSAWTLIELLRHPEILQGVVDELDNLYQADESGEVPEISFRALRAIPKLEAAFKETLRLHPPLILLLRLIKEDIEIGDRVLPAGSLIGASPRLSNRLPESFPDPEAFDPGRYIDPRQEDILNRWTWVPFGAGRHKCVGSAFAMMQMKAIFSVLLRDFTFELSQPEDTYRDNLSKMVIQLAQPCKVTYKRRERS
ncbi:MAG: cytochrome P450 [Marmoricola sp.]